MTRYIYGILTGVPEPRSKDLDRQAIAHGGRPPLHPPPPSVSPEQSYHSVVRRPPRRPSWQHPTCSNLALFFLVNVHTDSSPVSTGVPYNLFCQLGLFNLMLFRPSFHLHVPIFGFAFGLARSFESARF